MKGLQKEVESNMGRFLKKAKGWLLTWSVDTVERQIIPKAIVGGKGGSVWSVEVVTIKLVIAQGNSHERVVLNNWMEPNRNKLMKEKTEQKYPHKYMP